MLGVNRLDYRSVRARRQERARQLPGDELLASSVGTFTHGITIRASRADVWPWLAQMGAGTRGGWYSYDWLDNGRQRSAQRIIPELQHLNVGMLFPAGPGVTDGFSLLAYEPQRLLILAWLSPDSVPLVTWAFLLEEINEHTTRLVVRARGGAGYQFHGLPWPVAKHAVRAVHFLMERRQLLGIAQRAEALARARAHMPEARRKAA